MKKLLKTAFHLSLLVVAISGFSQSVTSGVYLTFEDYKRGEMVYAINCSEESHKIRPHGKLNNDNFEVVHRGEKFMHDRSDIFGYRDCAGKDWRLYGTSKYQIAEAKSLIIYKLLDVSKTDLITGMVPQSYFFSIKDDEIKDLTVGNLKDSFPKNKDFHKMLDEAFGNGGNLAFYDTNYGMYTVNRLLAVTGG